MTFELREARLVVHRERGVKGRTPPDQSGTGTNDCSAPNWPKRLLKSAPVDPNGIASYCPKISHRRTQTFAVAAAVRGEAAAHPPEEKHEKECSEVERRRPFESTTIAERWF